MMSPIQIMINKITCTPYQYDDSFSKKQKDEYYNRIIDSYFDEFMTLLADHYKCRIRYFINSRGIPSFRFDQANDMDLLFDVSEANSIADILSDFQICLSYITQDLPRDMTVKTWGPLP